MKSHREDSNTPVVFCDFDGTITQLDVTDQILSQLAHPSWREVEQQWMQGLIGSRDAWNGKSPWWMRRWRSFMPPLTPLTRPGLYRILQVRQERRECRSISSATDLIM